jgi:hypothetical protein
MFNVQFIFFYSVFTVRQRNWMDTPSLMFQVSHKTKYKAFCSAHTNHNKLLMSNASQKIFVLIRSVREVRKWVEKSINNIFLLCCTTHLPLPYIIHTLFKRITISWGCLWKEQLWKNLFYLFFKKHTQTTTFYFHSKEREK